MPLARRPHHPVAEPYEQVRRIGELFHDRADEMNSAPAVDGYLEFFVRIRALRQTPFIQGKVVLRTPLHRVVFAQKPDHASLRLSRARVTPERGHRKTGSTRG